MLDVSFKYFVTILYLLRAYFLIDFQNTFFPINFDKQYVYIFTSAFDLNPNLGRLFRILFWGGSR